MSDKEYYSFEEVLKDLEMEEQDLKRLVSAGEIRAFRDRDTMRFKATDVERLKGQPASDGGGDELELELGDDLDLGEELDLGESGAEDLVLEDDGGLGVGGVEEVDLGAQDYGEADEASPRRRVPRSQAQAAEAEATDGAGLWLALFVGFAVLIFANFAAWSAVSGETNSLTRFLADMFT